MAETFGQYELLGRIAMGGMAEILRARQRSEAGFEKDVVIKRILPQYADDVDFIRMFQDEAVLAAKLSHPNIVQVFDFKNVDGAYFIAMEYVEGVDLRRLTQYGAKIGKPIGQNRSVQVALAMARGLGHAHERVSGGQALKIVHRDVSPHNVLVSLAGDVKVMDFGIAKAAARAVKTSTGILKGKLSYMSPEQALGLEIDHRTDIYATGIVLWEMLANKRAFVGDSELELLARVQRGEITPIREVYPEITPELEACVNKFLARDKEQRYQRMREAERDLAAILTKLGGPEAAGLEDYAAEVIPRDVVDALRGLAEPAESTKQLHAGAEKTAALTKSEPNDIAATQVFESTDAEKVGPKTQVLTTPPASVTVRVPPPRPRWLLVAGALVAAVAGAAMTATLLKPDAAPVVMQQAAPVAASPGADDAATPSPAPAQEAPPLPAAPAVVADAKGPEVKATDVKVAEVKGNEVKGNEARSFEAKGGKAVKPVPGKIVTPPPAKQGEARLELQDCPIGALVYDGGRVLGAISPRNKDSFPVPPGARSYSVKTATGAPAGGPTRMNLAEGEMDSFRCR